MHDGMNQKMVEVRMMEALGFNNFEVDEKRSSFSSSLQNDELMKWTLLELTNTHARTQKPHHIYRL